MSISFETDSSEISAFVPTDAVFAGACADKATLRNLLSGLSRDDTLLICARINQLRLKYGVAQAALGPRERPKGTAQLAKIIRALSHRE